MKINFELKGVAITKQYLVDYTAETAKRISKALVSGGLGIERDAKAACPVKTGRLRSSISTNWSGSGLAEGITSSPAESGDGVPEPDGPDGLIVEVGTNVEYAPHIEAGHSVSSLSGFQSSLLESGGSTFVAGRPFLFPAYLKNEGRIIKEVEQALKS